MMNSTSNAWTSIAYDTSTTPEISIEELRTRLELLYNEYDSFSHQNSYDERNSWCAKKKREVYDLVHGYKKWIVANKQGYVQVGDALVKMSRQEFTDWFIRFLDAQIAQIESYK